MPNCLICQKPAPVLPSDPLNGHAVCEECQKVLDLGPNFFERAIYLTSGICENTGHVSSDQLFRLNLDYQMGAGTQGFYPLSNKESRYIGDGLNALDGSVILNGYSFLYNHQKWLGPTIEIDYRTETNVNKDEDAEDYFTRDEAWEWCISIVRNAVPILGPIGGRMKLDIDDDRMTVIALIPMAHAYTMIPDMYQKWLISWFHSKGPIEP